MEYEKVLKSGKTVLIYEDVLTETKLEGKAVSIGYIFVNKEIPYLCNRGIETLCGL